MNNVSNAIPAHVIAAGSAANADDVGAREHQHAAPATGRGDASGGWDAYEVWRRFIKDARERRQHQE